MASTITVTVTVSPRLSRPWDVCGDGFLHARQPPLHQWGHNLAVRKPHCQDRDLPAIFPVISIVTDLDFLAKTRDPWRSAVKLS